MYSSASCKESVYSYMEPYSFDADTKNVELCRVYLAGFAIPHKHEDLKGYQKLIRLA